MYSCSRSSATLWGSIEATWRQSSFQVLENFRPGDKIGFATEVHQYANSPSRMHVRKHHPVPGLSALFALGADQGLLGEELLRFGRISPGLFQGMLDLHHRSLGLLPQFFDVFGRDRHFYFFTAFANVSIIIEIAAEAS